MTAPPPDELDQHRETVEGLRARNEQLEAELKEVRERERRLARRRTRVAGFAVGLASRVLLGPGLVVSIRAWRDAVSRDNPLPAPETDELAAAVIRRVIRVGLVAVAVAFLPGALLVWQNLLIGSQVRQQGRQIEQQAADIRQRTQDSIIARRAQLIDILYTQDCGLLRVGGAEQLAENPPTMDDLALARCQPREFSFEAETPSVERSLEFARQMSAAPTVARGTLQCPPRAHLRARQEAALAFVEIERGRNQSPNLAYLDLAYAIFGPEDLSGVSFAGANLPWVQLGEADLRGARFYGAYLPAAQLFGANLMGADFTWANLCFANFKGADLREATLQGANLRTAKFRGANLEGADLRAADLRRASISIEQLNSARGDATTLLPLTTARPQWADDEPAAPAPSPSTDSIGAQAGSTVERLGKSDR